MLRQLERTKAQWSGYDEVIDYCLSYAANYWWNITMSPAWPPKKAIAPNQSGAR